MQDFSENFYIIGHRGAAGEYLENSLEGFKHALTLDIDAIELDVREHSSELWVIHDDDLERLTGTAGLFEEHANPSSIRLRNGETVPTLKQVLDLYWGKLPVNIEIKSISNLKLLLDLLADYPALEPAVGLPWIIISSFDHVAIRQLRQLDCPWPLAPITLGIPLQVDAELTQIAPFSWHFYHEYLDFDLLRRLREQGVQCLVFTVNDKNRAQQLRQQGVAGIITDIPSQMTPIDQL
jgi:glycerophosphoryl diester phosphodiesterase